MALQISNVGERLDLTVAQGATLGPFLCSMRNPAAADGTPGAPVNLAGSTITGTLRKRAADAVPTATFNVAVTDPANGAYSFGLSAAQTAAIPAADRMVDPGSRYVWDLQLQDSAGRVTQLYWGDCIVHREVSHA